MPTPKDTSQNETEQTPLTIELRKRLRKEYYARKTTTAGGLITKEVEREADYWLDKLESEIEGEKSRIRRALTDFGRKEPPYKLTAWDDREAFRNHVLSLLSKDNQK